MFMISVRFPYALTSQAVQPELWFNALDTFEGLCETDIHHTVIRHSLLKLLDMWYGPYESQTPPLIYCRFQKGPSLKLHMQTLLSRPILISKLVAAFMEH